MMVIDASVVLGWCFEDERTDAHLSILDRVVNDGAAAPDLLLLEVSNVLRVAVRRRRLTDSDVSERLREIQALPIRLHRVGWAELAGAVALAAEHGLTVYDATISI